MKSNYHLSTQAIHACVDSNNEHHAITPGIVMSVNHEFSPDTGGFSAQELSDIGQGPFLYAAWSNPTVKQLEQRLAVLENAEDALATATGMAAISAVFLSLLKQGDHLVISDVCYAAVYEFATQVLPEYGIDVSVVDVSDHDAVLKVITERTRLVHCESPCNPILRLVDITGLSRLLKEKNILLSMDSTFSTPVITKPLDFGADLVIHSLTKFINGHGDVLGGCILGSSPLIAKIRLRAGAYLGATLPAHSAWLIMRGMETMYSRVKHMSESALEIAKWLNAHPRVGGVRYPGLPDHEQFYLAEQQMRFFGGIIAFQVDDIDLIAQRFAKESTLFYYAFSIGHQRSLAVALKTDELDESTYRFNQEQRQRFERYAGQGLIRLSIGLEASEDLIAELVRLLR